MTTYVLIPGGYGGAWQWRRVVQILTGAGHEMYYPSLTGMGERVHLANPDVDLATHIQDVVNFIKFSNLSNVILVGLSYSGTVATGVAELVPAQIKRLVYLDAYVPQDGQAMVGLLAARSGGGDDADCRHFGRWLAGPVPSHLDSRCTPQPIRTATQPVVVRNPSAAALPRRISSSVRRTRERELIRSIFRLSRQPRGRAMTIAISTSKWPLPIKFWRPIRKNWRRCC